MRTKHTPPPPPPPNAMPTNKHERGPCVAGAAPLPEAEGGAYPILLLRGMATAAMKQPPASRANFSQALRALGLVKRAWRAGGRGAGPARDPLGLTAEELQDRRHGLKLIRHSFPSGGGGGVAEGPASPATAGGGNGTGPHHRGCRRAETRARPPAPHPTQEHAPGAGPMGGIW